MIYAGPRIGSMFSCAGGLDLAALAVLGGEIMWHAEIDPAGCKVLAARWPGVPNLGDVSAIDWSTVPPVDVLIGGFPCQDVSLAGRGAGLAPGTRTGLWAEMAAAVAALRPRLVLLENVRGLLSARAASDVEPCPWCLGDDPDEPALRALGAVLGDLAGLGFDAEWVGLPASEIGACHQRFRVFILAWPASHADGVGSVRGGAARGRRAGSAHHDLPVADTSRVGRGEGRPEPAGQLGGSGDAERGDAAPPDANGFGDAEVDQGAHLIERERPSRGWRAVEPAGPARGCVAAVGGAPGEPASRRGPASGDAEPDRLDWGPYELAIRRWESVIGRPAPVPTVTGVRGGQQLSARFVEWMQGLPEGWVTDVPGVSRNDALRLLGGMVVPQQGAAALRELLFRAGFVESLDGAA